MIFDPQSHGFHDARCGRAANPYPAGSQANREYATGVTRQGEGYILTRRGEWINPS